MLSRSDDLGGLLDDPGDHLGDLHAGRDDG
jgi:hypothetical protein